MNDQTILVVDDDDDVRVALVDELSPLYNVTSASSGEEAFALLAARRFDAVISDLRMPDHDGIEVLDFAEAQQEGIVRILLTGYLDDRAHKALLKPGAPFKVGKPWYDEVEVVLKRAFEQRRRTRVLSASLETAFALHQIETSLASVPNLRELGEVLVLRAAAITGVTECAALLDGATILGHIPAEAAGRWRISLPVDSGGHLTIVAHGIDAEARELVTHLIQLAQRQGGAHRGTPEAAGAPGAARSRIDELLRQATVGSLTGALIHDIAGILQGVEGAMLQIAALAAERNDAELVAASDDLLTASRDAMGVFVAMRRFIREGTASVRDVPLRELVHRAVGQVGGFVRERANLRIAELPPLAVKAAEALAVQTLVACLRNAAEHSPASKSGVVDVGIRVDDDRVTIEIVDDGPGVSDDIAATMFEPHRWQRSTEAGAGLAIADHAMRLQGGTIAYRRAPGRGACFTLAFPRA